MEEAIPIFFECKLRCPGPRCRRQSVPPAEFCGMEFLARTAMALTMEMLQLFGLVLGQIPKRRVPSVDLPLPVTLLLFFFHLSYRTVKGRDWNGNKGGRGRRISWQMQRDLNSVATARAREKWSSSRVSVSVSVSLGHQKLHFTFPLWKIYQRKTSQVLQSAGENQEAKTEGWRKTWENF